MRQRSVEMSESVIAHAPSSPGAPRRVGRYRWTICGLLFFCTTINYIDRNALSVLKTTLQAQMGWSDVDYGWITFAFTAAYAAFPSLMGTLIDRFGVKRTLMLALILWSIMSAAHAGVRTVLAFAAVRFVLGFAEAANFPAAIKAVALWFPQKERALATGLFNSGANLGVMASFATVWLANTFGWQAAFVTIGAIGFVWLIFWQRGFDVPERSTALSAAELSYIRADQPPERERLRMHWTALLRYRQIWPFLVGKGLTDPVWWFYLFWLPSYLERERGQNPMKSALLLIVIYTGASIGSIVGGWISGYFISRGLPVGRARLLAMLIPAVSMPLVIFAYYTDSFVLAVLLISIATAAHQWWSANIYTTATDLFPTKVSGAVIGLGSTTGGLGGMFMTLLVALVVQWTGNQQMVFIWAGLMHPLSLLIYWLWIGTSFEPASTDRIPDLSRVHPPVLAGGIATMLFGLGLSALIYLNWALAVRATSVAGAAQAATAAAGIVLIGTALVYAGMGRKVATAEAS